MFCVSVDVPVLVCVCVQEGITPLVLACRNGHVPMAQALILTHRVDVDAGTTVGALTLTHSRAHTHMDTRTCPHAALVVHSVTVSLC